MKFNLDYQKRTSPSCLFGNSFGFKQLHTTFRQDLRRLQRWDLVGIKKLPWACIGIEEGPNIGSDMYSYLEPQALSKAEPPQMTHMFNLASLFILISKSLGSAKSLRVVKSGSHTRCPGCAPSQGYEIKLCSTAACVLTPFGQVDSHSLLDTW